MKKSENVLENAVLEEGTRGGRMLEALQHCRMLHNDIDYSLVQLFIIAIGVYVHVRASAHARSIYSTCARARVGAAANYVGSCRRWLLGSCARLKMACFEALSCALS